MGAETRRLSGTGLGAAMRRGPRSRNTLLLDGVGGVARVGDRAEQFWPEGQSLNIGYLSWSVAPRHTAGS